VVFPAIAPNPVAAGQSASAGVQLLSGVIFFNDNVALTCSIQPSPQLAPQCSVSPSSGNPAAGQNLFSLAVSTTAPTFAASPSPSFRGSRTVLYALSLP